MSVRYFAADALRKLNKTDQEVIQTLIDCLDQTEDSVICEFSIASLGNLGEQAKIIESHLVKWIEKHQQSEYVNDGIDALWNIVTAKA